MLQIHIKTYNHFLLKEFISQLNDKENFKFITNFVSLPPKGKNFTVKKSPHVFGRSKEKYFLRVYSGIITVNYLRKRDVLSFLLLIKSSTYIEALGLKFTFCEGR